MKKLNEKGFGLVEALLILVIVGLIITVSWLVYERQQGKTDDNTQTSQHNSMETEPKQEKQADIDYGALEIKEHGMSLELSEDIEDAYYKANDIGSVGFGVRSLDHINGCKVQSDGYGGFDGVADLLYGGGGSEYEEFKNNPNSSQVDDRFFFLIAPDCRSKDPVIQKKIKTVQDAFEEASKTIKIKDFSNSYYGRD